jgi:chromate transporter
MFAATTWVLLRAAGHDWRGWLLAAASIAFVLCTRRNPLFMIALGALAGLLGVLQ